MSPRSPETLAARTRSSTWFRHAAKAGFAMNGVVSAVIGSLAIAVGIGGASASGADQTGALEGIASAPGGAVLLWAIAIATGALGLWNLVDGILADGSDAKERWAARAKHLGKGIAYLVIAGTAGGIAAGGGGGGSGGGGSGGGEEQVAGGLLSAPAGVVLVIALGLGIVGVGAYLVAKGVRRKFLDDLKPTTGTVHRVVLATGTAGYVARGVAFGIVGALFVAAGATADPQQAGGLDSALAALAGLPFGQVLLVLVGLGFIASGVYGVVRAKYARL